MAAVERNSDEDGHSLRQRHGQPDAVYVDDPGEDQDEHDDEDQRAQRGNERGNEAVSKRCEIPGEKDIQADEQEDRAEQLQALPCQVKDMAAAHKQVDDLLAEQQ